MTEVYFGGIDSAVDDALPSFARSAGLMMLGLLLHDQRPILSQTQAFDNAELLELLDERSPDADPFLALVVADKVGVRLYRGGLAGDPRSPDYPTLLNAFGTALEGAFVLSAWPELQEGPDQRAAVADLIRRERAEDLVGRLGQVADGDLLLRLQALVRLDHNLRRSPKPELAEPLPAMDLYDRSMLAVRSMAARGGGGGAALARLEADVDELRARGTGEHRARSAWRNLIAVRRQAGEGDDQMWTDLSALVDVAYHITVAASLGVARMRVVAASDDVGQLAAEAWEGTQPAMDGVHWVDDPGFRGMGWGLLRDALPRVEVEPPGPRRRVLAREACEGLLVVSDDGPLSGASLIGSLASAGIGTVVTTTTGGPIAELDQLWQELVARAFTSLSSGVVGGVATHAAVERFRHRRSAALLSGTTLLSGRRR